MGERGAMSRYLYWSERRIHQIAEDNDIRLQRRFRLTAKSPKIPFVPDFEVSQEANKLGRPEIARRIEMAIGAQAVEDFVNPPPVRFAKGIGRVSFAEFAGTRAHQNGVVVHTSTQSSTGVRVEVCLFGSLDNMADYAAGSAPTLGGWVSSAAPAIESFLLSHGTVNNSQWDDLESLSVEALKIARYQGITHSLEEHAGKPWTRGFTLGHADDSVWYAQIYSDVELDKARWDWQIDEEVDRILIGAPLWFRSPLPQAITRYDFFR